MCLQGKVMMIMEFLVTSVPTMMSSIVTTQTDYKNNHLAYGCLTLVQCSAVHLFGPTCVHK